MKTTLTITWIAVALLLVGAPGCSFSIGSKTTSVADTDCVCADGQEGSDIWCADCGVGYIGGKKATACNGCFSAAIGGPACSDCAIN